MLQVCVAKARGCIASLLRRSSSAGRRGRTIAADRQMADDEIQALGGLPLGIEVPSKPIPFDRLHAIASRVARNKLLTPHPG